MIDEKMLRRIQLLGLEHFVRSDPYTLKEIEGKAVVEAQYSYWFAEIELLSEWGLSFDIPEFKQRETYWLFMIKTREYYRGYMLFPSIREPFDREFGGADPFAFIDLTGWEDPVAAALKSFNLSPLDDSVQRSTTWEYRLSFKTWNGFGDFWREPLRLEKPLVDTVWEALFVATKQFVERYDDDEMSSFARYLHLVE